MIMENVDVQAMLIVLTVPVETNVRVIIPVDAIIHLIAHKIINAHLKEMFAIVMMMNVELEKFVIMMKMSLKAIMIEMLLVSKDNVENSLLMDYKAAKIYITIKTLVISIL